MIPSSEKKNIQRKEFIKRILEKRSHIPSSTKEEQSVVCAKQGASQKEAVAEVVGNEVNAFSATPSAQRDGTADAVASGLGMKEALKTSAEVVGESIGDGKDERPEEMLTKADLIDMKTRSKIAIPNHVDEFAKKGVSLEQQKANLQKLRVLNNKQTARNYELSDQAKAPSQTFHVAEKARNLSPAMTHGEVAGHIDNAERESRSLSQGVQSMGRDPKILPESDEFAGEHKPPNTAGMSKEDINAAVNASIKRLDDTLNAVRGKADSVRELNRLRDAMKQKDGEKPLPGNVVQMKKSDVWSGDAEANKMDSRKNRPAPAPKQMPKDDGIDLKFDPPPMPKPALVPPAPRPVKPTPKPLQKADPVTPPAAPKRTSWMAKHGGKWYAVKDIVDNKKPVEHGGGNMYHLEGLDKPVHASQLEDLELHRQ